MRKNLELACKVLVYATFFVPLIVVPSSFIFPFIVPKILLLRTLILVMLGCYILLVIINGREYAPRTTLLNYALIAFLVSFALSTFIGVDSYHSFWDNHERMLGLFTIFHYVAYYFVASAVFKNWSEWRQALRIFLIAGSLVMVVGLMQVSNPYFLLNQGSDRVASTLGNAIYMGGYGLFLIFVAYLLFVKENDTVWRWIEAACGFLALFGMFYSGTRGSMLGFVVSIGFIMIGYAIMLKNRAEIRTGLIAALIACAIGLVVLYNFRTTAFVSGLPAVGRAVNTSFADVKNSARWIAWDIAYKSWTERPVFGWGPNNFFYAFNKHYNPRSLEFGYGETWFDNAHNIIMNTLAVQGIVGLVTYLGIFAVAIYSLLAAKKRGALDLHLAIIGCAFLIAHLVQNITVFENPTSYLYFMFWLAMINALVNKDEETGSNKVQNSNVVADKLVGTGGLAAAMGVVVILIFIFNIQPARANMRTLEALRAVGTNPEVSVPVVNEALSFSSPHIDDIRNDIARTIAGVVGNPQAPMSPEIRKALLQIALDAQEMNVRLHPLDIRTHLLLAQLNQTKAILENNSAYLVRAYEILRESVALSPKRQQVLYTFAAVGMQVGRQDEAIKAMEQTIQDNPKISESYWRLAYFYSFLKQPQKAQEIIGRAEKNGVVFNTEEKQMIASFLATTSTTKTR